MRLVKEGVVAIETRGRSVIGVVDRAVWSPDAGPCRLGQKLVVRSFVGFPEDGNSAGADGTEGGTCNLQSSETRALSVEP